MSPAVILNQQITTVVTANGGHCAFVEHAAGEYDGYWAEKEVVRFVNAAVQSSGFKSL
jgi:predicted alpha/beta-fold hydrolase